MQALGYSAAGIGDVNGDGRDDFVIGTHVGGAPSICAEYVMFGRNGTFIGTTNTSTLAGVTGFKMTSSSLYFGASVAGIGDVNGDGMEDFMVTADAYGAKTVYVLFGRNGGFAGTIGTNSLTGSTGFKITSSDLQFGYSVAGIGDVNGDGRQDLVIGTYVAQTAYVLFGRNGGFAGTIDTSTITGSTGFKITSVDSQFGRSVAGLGDVNGDGRPDFVVGASSAKTAYVVFGKVGGWSSFDTSTLTGSTGFKITSSDSGFGVSAAGIGDVNGDGRPDFVVGASSAKTAYVVFGKVGSFSSPVSTSTLTGSTGFKMTSVDTSFGYSAAGIGDVNGDGRSDFVVGADGAKTAYVVFGKVGSFSSPIDTSTLTGGTGFKITSSDSGFGFSADGIGDVNGDGIDDFVVGAPGYYAGAAYVVFGQPTPTPSHSHTESRSRTATDTRTLSITPTLTKTIIHTASRSKSYSISSIHPSTHSLTVI